MRPDPSITASDPEHSAWVAANAGSGKTYTLANRVTRLLLDGSKPERILCLTYTKAAAAEMQTRLFDQLGRWAMLPDKELRRNIETIGAIAGTAEDLRKARRLFAEALETPGGLKIQTIHAFCQNLLSRFPLEAGVPPSFRVLDDQTARELMAEARARVLERAGAGDKQRYAAIARLVRATGEKQMRDLLDTALGTDRRKLERFFASLGNRPLDHVVRHAHSAGDDTPLAVAEEFCAVAKAEAAMLKQIAAWLSAGGNNDKERSEKLTFALACETDAEMFAALRAALLKGDGERYAKYAVAAIAKVRPELLAAYLDFIDRFCIALDRYRAADAAELCHAVLVLADAARKEYDLAKRARGALDYDDLIVGTLALLKHKSAAEWVLYKLDGGLDHVLIDEAQDTSPEQWEIVKLLTGEFFAGAGARHEGLTRTVFAVGDEKQSIFSFQGADPREFDLNRKYFLELAKGAEQYLVEAPLIQSRRSAPEILSFVDAVFKDEAARAGLTSGNTEVAHEAFRAKAKGRVELWPTFKPADEPERDPWAEVDAVPESSPIVKLALKLAATIADWIAKRVRLPDHANPIRPGDIMILLPRREPFGPEIIKRLKERGVPVAGADRVQLTEQIAVMDLIALGRFALQPDDDLTLASLLRSPLCGLSENELYALCYERGGTVWSALSARREETPAFADAHEFLTAMRARADFMPPFEFYSYALVARGMRARLLSRLGAEANDAIDEFVSLSLAYEEQNTPSLEGFLHWIETGGAEIKRDMERGRDEVRVMTVHGAKGLEADIVILPDTCSLPDPPWMKGHLLHGEDGVRYPYREQDAAECVRTAKAAAQEEVLKEHRRLLYVALTRAKDRLYVCGFENKRGIKPGSWYRLCEAAAKSIGTPVLRGEDTLYIVGDPDDQYGLALENPQRRITVPEWATTPPSSEAPRPRLIRPSDATDTLEPSVLSPLEQGSAKRFRRGLLVHSLIARLPDLAPEKRRDAALKFLRARDVGEDEAVALAGETLAVLDDPNFAPAFSTASMAEAAITASLPELGEGARINGRIDRLAVTKDEVLIVDFKTNRPPPERAADVDTLYLAQMALYRAAAQKIFPGGRIACALIWTEGPRLMPLAETLLEAQLRQIRARLDPSGLRS